jgi:hypothetical protein
MPAGETDRELSSAAPAAKKNKLSQPSSLVDTAAAAAAATATKSKVKWRQENNTISNTDEGAQAGGACAKARRRGGNHGGRHLKAAHSAYVRPMGDYLAQGTAEVRRRRMWVGSCDRRGERKS